MATLVLRDDFEARTDGEAQHWNKGVPESDPVHIIFACPPDQRPRVFIAAEKHLQDRGLHSLRRLDLPRCSGAAPIRIRRNVIANEPAAGPGQTEFLHPTALPSLQRPGYCRQIDEVRDLEMVHALTYAPCAMPGLPIELFEAQSLRDRLCSSISGLQLRNQSQRPSRQSRIAGCRHLVRISVPGK